MSSADEYRLVWVQYTRLHTVHCRAVIVKRVILRNYKVLVDHEGPMEYYRGRIGSLSSSELYFATIKCWWITKVPWSIIEEGMQNQRFNSITQIPHYMYFLQMHAATLNSCALRFHIHLRHGKGTTSYNYQVSFVWFCVSARNAAMLGFGGIPLMCLVAASIRAILRAKFI